MTRVLGQLLERLGRPELLVVDNGPEFAGQVMDAWAYRRGITVRVIDPGKPTENAYIESFNGEFRDECLNQHWLVSLEDARRIIAAWRDDYKQHRPHRALGQRTPAAFAQQCARTSFSLTATG